MIDPKISKILNDVHRYMPKEIRGKILDKDGEINREAAKKADAYLDGEVRKLIANKIIPPMKEDSFTRKLDYLKKHKK